MIRRLPYARPFDWDHLLGFLGRRAIAGVEWCDGESYRRTVRVGRRAGVLRAWNDAVRGEVVVEVPSQLKDAGERIAARMRGLFDLDHRPARLRRALGADPLLGPILRERPGIRLPGAWDGFEIAVRAVVGQQVSVAAARGLLGRLAAETGERIEGEGGEEAILFPDARRLANAALRGMPASRLATLRAVAEAVASRKLVLERNAPVESAVAKLCAIRGIGEWTAGYVGMRALGAPDAFPAGDLVLRRAAGGITARELSALAESWRPWRAYASMLLWSR
jgi:AraC family transcriptional regulator of adaptative response / DNA-3-methyladenine glycosylase II